MLWKTIIYIVVIYFTLYFVVRLIVKSIKEKANPYGLRHPERPYG